MKNIEHVLPMDIEKNSFRIIEEELAEMGIVLEGERAAIIKRAIHTSADFEYVNTLTFSKDAIESAHRAIKNGAVIVTDTNMALAGINKKALAEFGCEIRCFMAEEDVAREAKEREITRAAVSMEHAAKLERPLIFAIGNAPTALIQLYEMIQNKQLHPELIIGVPVGFVNVVASKELIMETDVPYIINRGRKGGSNIAAAICNALLYQLNGSRK